MKKCSDCSVTKPFEYFYTKGKGKSKTYYEAYCKDCSIKRSKVRSCNKGYPRTLNSRNSANQLARNRRLDPVYKATNIYNSVKAIDKRKGFVCDLDKDKIKKLIDRGCLYCGESDILKMSLDRINNCLGHTIENVNPSCLRCNLVRGSMPYAAWLKLCDGMRSARVEGLFEDWDGPLLNRARTMEASNLAPEGAYGLANRLGSQPQHRPSAQR